MQVLGIPALTPGTPPASRILGPKPIPAAQELGNALKDIEKVNNDILKRYEEIKNFFADKPLTPASSKLFEKSIVEYLALINQQYIIAGRVVKPTEEDIGKDPAAQREEWLRTHGFTVSGEKSKKEPLDMSFAGSPAAIHAIEHGADLTGDNE